MAKGGRPGFKTEGDEANPVIQTLNIILQKVIQVNKPTRYYGDKEKTKIFIY